MSPQASKCHHSLLSVHLALASVSLIYGFFFVAMKLLLTEVGETRIILLRLALSAILVAGIEWGFIRSRFQSWGQFFRIAGLGLVGIFLVQNLLIIGIHRTTAFHAALIMAMIPLMTTLWSMGLRREPFSGQKLLGIGVAFLGVAWLLLSKHSTVPLPSTYLVGDAIILLNTLAFSGFLIGSQDVLKQYPSFSFMAYGYIISGLLYAAVYFQGVLPDSADPAFVFTLSPLPWGLVAYMVLFASIGTYTLNNYALSRIEPSVVAVYIFLQPVLSAILGYYLLGDAFTWQMAQAAALTFAGLVVATRSYEPGRCNSKASRTGQ